MEGGSLPPDASPFSPTARSSIPICHASTFKNGQIPVKSQEVLAESSKMGIEKTRPFCNHPTMPLRSDGAIETDGRIGGGIREVEGAARAGTEVGEDGLPIGGRRQVGGDLNPVGLVGNARKGKLDGVIGGGR